MKRAKQDAAHAGMRMAYVGAYHFQRHLESYPHQVHVLSASNNAKEIADWIETTAIGKHDQYAMIYSHFWYYWFEDASSAMLFKLRFG